MPFDTSDLEREINKVMPKDAGDSDLLNPGSDGLVYGESSDVLRRLYEQREAGASIDQVRRAAGVDHFQVTNSQIEAALEGGRWIKEWEENGTVRPRRRYWGGVGHLPTKAEFEAQQRAKAQS